MMTLRAFGAAAIAIACLAPMTASAGTYVLANFSGGVFGGDVNVRSPFASAGLFPGMTLAGAFVFDETLAPPAGSGYVNVAQTDFPDIARIPAATAFTFSLGSLAFTAANDTLGPGPAIQYLNGEFNGFAYRGDFAYQGAAYQLKINGGLFSVVALDAQGGEDFSQGPLVSGYLNVGNAALTGKTPYAPPPVTEPGAVPEPATWALLILGFGTTGAVLRRRPRALAAA